MYLSNVCLYSCCIFLFYSIWAYGLFVLTIKLETYYTLPWPALCFRIYLVAALVSERLSFNEQKVFKTKSSQKTYFTKILDQSKLCFLHNDLNCLEQRFRSQQEGFHLVMTLKSWVSLIFTTFFSLCEKCTHASQCVLINPDS